MNSLLVTPDEMPSWLTIDFFRKLFSISGEAKFKTVEHACAKGDNFASKIYRVSLEFADGHSKPIIVKSRPVGSGFSEEYSIKFNIFPKEIEMYQLIGSFEKLLQAHGSDVVFAPK